MGLGPCAVGRGRKRAALSLLITVAHFVSSTSSASHYEKEAIDRASETLQSERFERGGDEIFTVGNRSYLGCKGSGWEICKQAFGHSRLTCESDVKIRNAHDVEVMMPPICACSQEWLYSHDHTPPGGAACEEKTPDIRCLYGGDEYRPCARHDIPLIVIIVAGGFINIVVSFLLWFSSIYLIGSLVKHKALTTNATGSTLFFTVLAVGFLILWTVYYIRFPLAGSDDVVGILSLSVGIPGAAMFSTISFMNLSLMWVQVAASSKSLRKGRSNLGRKPQILIAVFSSVFAIIEILCFGVFELKTVGSAVSLLFIIGIVIAFQVGSRRLAAATSVSGATKRSRAISRIITTARNVSFTLFVFIIANLIYATATIMDGFEPSFWVWLNLPTVVIGILPTLNVAVYIQLRYIQSSTAFSRHVASSRGTTTGGRRSSRVQPSKHPTGEDRITGTEVSAAMFHETGAGSFTIRRKEGTPTPAGDDTAKAPTEESRAPAVALRKASSRSGSQIGSILREKSDRSFLDQHRRNSYSVQHALGVGDIEHALCERLQEPMMAVSASKFFDFGRIPRSSDNIARPFNPKMKVQSTRTLFTRQWVVFVSHRWCRTTHPDDEDNAKYLLLCRGLRAIIERDGLDESNVSVWIDYACIDQDDEARLLRGVESLVTYVSIADYILIPVMPTPQAMTAFSVASHATDLWNYGERAWCRVEFFIYLLIQEVRGHGHEQPMRCFAFGSPIHCPLDDAVVPKSIRLEGRFPRGRLALSCFSNQAPVSSERLVSLAGYDHDERGGLGGASFLTEELPSRGELSVEADREKILQLENSIRHVYCVFAIKQSVKQMRNRIEGSQKSTSLSGSLLRKFSRGGSAQDGSPRRKKSGAGLPPARKKSGAGLPPARKKSGAGLPPARKRSIGRLQSGSSGSARRKSSSFAISRKKSGVGVETEETEITCMLDGKQLKCAEAGFLIKVLEADHSATNGISGLSLRNNARGDDAMYVLLRDLCAKPTGASLRLLDLSGNSSITEAAAKRLGRYLSSGKCVLTAIGLAYTGVGAAGGKELAQALGTAHTTLAEINLEYTGQDESSTDALAEGMASHGTVVVRVKEAELPDETRKAFAMQVRANMAAAAY